MRIDWGVIRNLLEKFEEEKIQHYLSGVGSLPETIRLEDFETREKFKAEAKDQIRLVFGHLLLCLDGNFIEGIEIKTSGNYEYTYALYSPRLTLKGHELLEQLRNKTIWTKIKGGAESLGVPLTVETISVLATKLLEGV